MPLSIGFVATLTVLVLVLRHYKSSATPPIVPYVAEIELLKKKLNDISAAHPEFFANQEKDRLWEQVKNDRAREKKT